MMLDLQELQKRVFNIKNQTDFQNTALDIFKYQYINNSVYKSFVDSLGKDCSDIRSLYEIPFLPVEFFKSQRIITGNFPVEKVFESSGTTNVTRAKHYVNDLGIYEKSFLKTFKMFYGDPKEYLIVALLPSYIEREGSSLVYMTEYLINKSKNPYSGFYKNNTEKLITAINKARSEKHKILLLGVTFALLDLAEKYSPDLSGVIIMETGGMKGRRKELTRAELHSILKEKLNVGSIHSEYGMTELLSQAYSKGDGIYFCPPWLKILIRDPLDPLTIFTEPGIAGGINIVDLANFNSCCFISAGDLGKLQRDGGFEVLGRFDNSDIRGCNLLVD
jgi:hypothetical protein